MDLEVALLIGAAVVGIVVGILHLVGYVPPRYRKMLKEIQAETANALRSAVGGAFGALDRRLEALDARLGEFLAPEGEDGPNPLESLPARLESLQEAITHIPQSIGAEVKAAFVQAQTEFAAEMAKQVPEQLMQQIPPEITGAMGGTVTQDRRRAGELKDAVGRGLLGPYGALIEQFMPPLYEYLVDNPDMVVQALQMPVIQKLIQGAARMAGKVGGGGGSSDNPFLKDMGP